MKESIGEYERVQIIPMNNNKNEPRIEGKPKNEVKREYFEEALKENRFYYFHGNMTDMQNGKKVLALFQYNNVIIAYGIVDKRIKVEEDGYVDPEDNFEYDGMLEFKKGSVCTVVDITNNELNKVLYKSIRFSNVLHILEPKTDEFHELLNSKLKNKED